MITADDLDKLCVLTTFLVEGNTRSFTQEDYDFLDEVAVHAEDVIASAHNTEDIEPDLAEWADDPFEDYDGLDPEYDEED